MGASTGGFTDVLLQRGARRVIALDVGRGAARLAPANRPRVVVMEGVNARHLRSAGPARSRFGLITADVSFISLRLVVPALLPHLAPDGWLVCLVKPQFEAGRRQVGRGGVVRDEGVRRRVIDDTTAALESLGLERVGLGALAHTRPQGQPRGAGGA